MVSLRGYSSVVRRTLFRVPFLQRKDSCETHMCSNITKTARRNFHQCSNSDSDSNNSNSSNNSSSSSNKNSNINSNNILPDVTGAIGGTPLVDLSRVCAHYGIDRGDRILGKLEYLNPGGSKKDRIAHSVVVRARDNGTLQPGQTVVELTSGNTGTGLAIVCALWGHPFVAVMSKGNSRERYQMMEALGATVVLVDKEKDNGKHDPNDDSGGGDSTEMGGGVSGADLDRVEEKTREVVESLNAFRVDQFVRDANFLAHYEGTGPELWRDSGKTITDFLDFVGTGGSFGGISSYLKEESDEGVRCYIVEPETAAVLGTVAASIEDERTAAVASGCHRIQGGGYMKSRDELPLIAPRLRSSLLVSSLTQQTGQSNELVDGYLTVTDEEAIEATRNLAKYEGIFAGYSAGANLAAAIKLLQQRARKPLVEEQERTNHTVAILICDSGLKYMSTDLWE